jgi:short subunit dehydrogenase-like uncharacterized protein
MVGQREFDIVIYGASGFTGRLVAEYMFQRYGADGEIRWAMAGRSRQKLEDVRAEMGIPDSLPLVVADGSDVQSLRSMVRRSPVIVTTVGPYALYGSGLVAACADAGTDYVDLCGEPAWMHEMIKKHAQQARDSGARIVFSCGFDSIPFDLGVYFLQQAAQKQFGAPVTRVRGRVRSMKGTFSGGTLASFRATMAAAAKDPQIVSLLTNPFALTPGFTGPAQPAGNQPEYDEVLGSWVAPFVMATINTKNIHRSNLLLQHQYGDDFVYDEMLLTGPGERGETMAKAVAEDKSMANDPRQPGEGPSQEERENGSYDILFVGETGDGRSIRASVQGDRDPGYGSTSKMIAESAVCLVKNPDLAGGGIWTPAPAMGERLIDRLQRNAGLSFRLEPA